VPKKGYPERITDFRPISLAHSFSKIISKILANRLGPELDTQIRELHKKKIPAMFIKLDISKAFDTVN
jgi:hypothetical protein